MFWCWQLASSLCWNQSWPQSSVKGRSSIFPWLVGEKQWESPAVGSPMQDAALCNSHCPPRLIPLHSCTAWGDKDALNKKGFPSLGIKLEQSRSGQFFYLILTPTGSLDTSPQRSFSGRKHLQGTELEECGDSADILAVGKMDTATQCLGKKMRSLNLQTMQIAWSHG